MKDTVDYLNTTVRYGRFYLIELIRLEGGGQTAHAAQVVVSPKSQPAAINQGKANQQGFLDSFPESYRSSIATVLSTASRLGWTLGWGAKGTSLRVKSPDKAEPLSVGWVFLPGDQWYSARHLTLGVDDSTLASHPTLHNVINAYVDEIANIPGRLVTPGKLRAFTFEPSTIPSALESILNAMESLSISILGDEVH